MNEIITSGTNHRNVFIGEDLRGFAYNNIANHSATLIHVLKLFKEKLPQIYQVMNLKHKYVPFYKFMYPVNQTVLAVYPQPGVGTGKRSKALFEAVENQYKAIQGFNINICENHVPNKPKKGAIPMYFPGARNARNEQIICGHYYPERHVVILYYNIFSGITQHTLAIYDAVLTDLQTMLAPLNLGSFKELSAADIRSLQIKKFFDQVRTKEKILQQTIISEKQNIDQQQRALVRSIREIELCEKQILTLKNSLDIFETDFEKKVLELEELPFVESAEINDVGIIVDVGKINYEISKDKKVYLGHYQCIILPNEIKIKNIDNLPERAAHPHVQSSGHLCLGSFYTKAYNLLGRYELKNLIYLLYSFLKSYNKDSSYISMTAYSIARKAEQKFDGDGNLLVNMPIKQTRKYTRRTAEDERNQNQPGNTITN